MRPRVPETEAKTLQEVHRLLRDLLKPNMRIYWTDFICSYLGMLAASVSAALLGLGSPLAWVAIVGAALLAYRSAVFIHEIVHFPGRRSFRTFRMVWNGLVGVPFFIPLFMYECHAEHHNWRHYGTRRDAEYVPLARLPRTAIVGVLAAAPVLPFYGLLRFGVYAPMSWVVPALRRRVWVKSSALKLDIEHEGAVPAPGRQARSWRLQEVATSGWLAAVAGGAIWGLIPLAWLAQFYLTYFVVVVLNTTRLLGAHRYVGDEEGMSVLEQVRDTLNYDHRPLLDALWAPVGLRLHALHHMVPALPYHQYSAAHARLLEHLPEDSFYHRSRARSLPRSLRELWDRAGHRREFDGLRAREILAMTDRTR